MLPPLASGRNEGRKARCFWSTRHTKGTGGQVSTAGLCAETPRACMALDSSKADVFLHAEYCRARTDLTDSTEWGSLPLVPISPKNSLVLDVYRKTLPQENREILSLSETLWKSSTAAASECKKTLYSSFLEVWRSYADSKVIYLRSRFIIFVKQITQHLEAIS